ncbi:MAG: DNA repair protein RadA [Lachnospiraceae bacterium]|nr:DNA repair protein RadA [Lachnospiraceae bacterium]
MAVKKIKSVFFCSECGNESPKWMGQCPACHAWNTMVEQEVTASEKRTKPRGASEKSAPVALSEISLGEEDRVRTGIGELDRVLGGGVVPGSMILVGGDPGIGKSTLLLQACRELSSRGQKVLYISGEESLKQIRMRAERLGTFSGELKLFCETDLNVIGDILKQEKPDIAVIDSIQTMYNEDMSGTPGSVSQVRESTAVLLQLSKSLSISVFIVGHVTKEGTVAGPRILEHMVDTVLYFEGDRHASYRILRGVKNRFGSTNEIGVFEMREDGLAEVANPSEYLLAGSPKGASGTVTACSIEGTRPILLEIQALVCQTSFGIPRRQSSGADLNRINLLMAVLEKRLGLHLGQCDAYVNIAGGMRVVEPAVDLAIAMAIAGSFLNLPVEEGLLAFGEVGLSGEVRGVSLPEQRVAEAAKLGYKVCVLPRVCAERAGRVKGIRLIAVDSVRDAIALIKK